MKTSVLAFFAILAVCSSLPVQDEEPRFVMFPDDNGVMHLVDLQEEVPQSRYVPDDDIQYLLFTRKNPTTPQQLVKGDNAGLKASNFDPSKPTRLTIHGWTGTANSGVNTVITPAYLKVVDCNVITVDWSKGASGSYLSGVLNVPPTGQSVGGFLDWLNTQGAAFSSFHIMGHSLGGHVVGITGRSATRGKVEYISSLDPAFPSWGNSSQRIRPTDGKYVEVIHTNGGALGLKEPVGHNDFYPNGGSNMPGCSITDTGCSHDRSLRYMADSLDHTGFMANLCPGLDEAISGGCTGAKLHMGGSKIKPVMGLLSLETNAAVPYYKG